MQITAQTISVHKHGSRYELDGTSSWLRARGGMRSGTITTLSGEFTVGLNDFCRTGATAGPVRLDSKQAFVPDGPANWQVGRTFRKYHGIVSCGANRIAVYQPAFRGRPIRVEITGTWAYQDLVVLTAVFLVMSRRRRDRLRALQIAAMTSHGPH